MRGASPKDLLSGLILYRHQGDNRGREMGAGCKWELNTCLFWGYIDPCPKELSIYNLTQGNNRGKQKAENWRQGLKKARLCDCFSYTVLTSAYSGMHVELYHFRVQTGMCVEYHTPACSLYENYFSSWKDHMSGRQFLSLVFVVMKCLM